MKLERPRCELNALNGVNSISTIRKNRIFDNPNNITVSDVTNRCDGNFEHCLITHVKLIGATDVAHHDNLGSHAVNLLSFKRFESEHPQRYPIA